jgi:light-regulated signal transduction histidine kinase (bacteriophytochrome)
MYGEDGAIDAVLMFGYEVTAEVMAKSKIMAIHAAHAKDLEEKVQQRTEDLRHAIEELQQMNKELVSFTYISSHDLQEPLRKIQTFSSRLLDTEYETLSEAGKEDFQRINNAARRMQTLIKELLIYSQTNIADRKFQQTDLDTLVREVLGEHAEVIKEKGVTVEVGSLCPARINAFQFRQVLHNLISNSLKFLRPGVPPLIRITCTTKSGKALQSDSAGMALQALSPEKNYCHFALSDNGIGFDPQYQERVFEIFQRLNSKSEYEGTGIGLAIVKKIVEHHYGIITASGEPGKGARFDIYLPAAA